jgi:hypothetical protein
MAAPHVTEEVVRDLWHFYDEHAAQARQHEDLRASITSILAGFAAALVGFAGIGGLKPSDAPAGVLVILLGALGALLSLKHYERNRFHVQVMHEVRTEIERLQAHPDSKPSPPGTLRDEAKKKHAERFKLRRQKREAGTWLVRVHLFQLWAALPLAISAVGVVVVVVALL